MATRTARKRKAMPRPARPRPATTVRPPAPNSVAPGPPASRGMPLPAGLAPRGRTLRPCLPAEHAVLQPTVTATCWVDQGNAGRATGASPTQKSAPMGRPGNARGCATEASRMPGSSGRSPGSRPGQAPTRCAPAPPTSRASPSPTRCPSTPANTSSTRS